MGFKVSHLTKFSIVLNGILLVLLLIVGMKSIRLQRWLAGFALGKVVKSIPKPMPDPVLATPLWKDQVKYQVTLTQRQQYQHCIFGDSITAALGNTLGDRSFNFAINSMSSVSLVQQMTQLSNAGLQCQQVVIAIGTNDADYAITGEQFTQNMRQAIALSWRMKATQILLLPAFYPTMGEVAKFGWEDPRARVNELNTRLHQLTSGAKIICLSRKLEFLYLGDRLHPGLTLDGLHLNAEGRLLYNKALLQMMQQAAKAQAQGN